MSCLLRLTWHVAIHSSSLCSSPALRNIWQEHNRGPHQLSFCAPPHPLSLSLVSLIVSQVSDSSKHCGFPHSHYTRGTRGEMCACMCMHRGGGVLHYSTVFSSAFYCWIRVNPKQRWHCCNFPLGNETSPHTTKRKKHCCKYCLNVVFL